MLHTIKTRAIALLWSRLEEAALRGDAEADEFCRYVDRLMRLLLEETLAIVPSSTVLALLNAGAGMRPRGDDKEDSDGAGDDEDDAQTLSAVALARRPASARLLAAFKELEPTSATSFMDVQGDGSCEAPSELLAAVLPTNLRNHHLLVLDGVAHTGQALCAAMTALLQAQPALVQDQIWVVTACIGAEALDQLQNAFAQVQIVTTLVLTTCDAQQADVDDEDHASESSRLQQVLVHIQDALASTAEAAEE